MQIADKSVFSVISPTANPTKEAAVERTIKMARVLLKKCFSPLITTIYRESCASMSNKSIKRQKVKVKHAQTPQMH